MNGPRLEGDGLVLRPLEPGDNPRLMNWRNSPQVRDQMFSAEEVTHQSQEGWYRAYLLDASQTRFVIDDAELGPVGCCGFTDIDERAGSARLTVFLGETSARGRGIARRALERLLSWGFGERALGTVIAEAFSDNAAALGLYARLGFSPAGPGRPRRGRAVSVLELSPSGGDGR